MLATCMAGLQAGDHVVSSQSIFGANQTLLKGLMGNFGIQTTFVNLTDLGAWQSAMQANTKMVFFETPTNPLMEIGDISAISEIAHRFNRDIKVVVDNCFCTPILQQPLSLLSLIHI